MNAFESIGRKYGTDKITTHGYHRYYDFYLNQFRDKEIKMLEIGVQEGYSLSTWLEYFPLGTIYGIDIGVESSGDRFKIFKSDQADVEGLAKIYAEIGKIDFIIDDGSHKPEDQIASFNFLFDHVLKDGGIYIIEDIETSYWRHAYLYHNLISYGYKHPRSAVEIFKKVVDTINDKYMSVQNKMIREIDNNEIPFRVRNMISTITFCQNTIIITKKDTSHEVYDNTPYILAYAL